MSPDIIIALISGLCVAVPNIVATIFSGYHNSKKVMKLGMLRYID